MSFAPPPPPVFAGDNYHIWVVKMRTYLQALDLWSAVESDVEPPPLRANPTIAQIRQHGEERAKKHKAMACLQNGVSDVIFTRIMACGTPVRYSDRIMDTVNNIRLLGENFSDSRVVEKVITTLPERGELADRRRILKKLFKQEPEKVLAQIRELRNLGLKERTNQEEKQIEMQAGGDIQCKSCKQYGHHEKICRNHEKTQAQPVQAKTAEDVQAQEEHVFTASCFAVNSKCSWLVDSGCSHHMAADESLFKDLDKSYILKVRIGNGNLIEAKGRGNVVINTGSEPA
ncbi:uncharacterized protein [Gossypium hirsutum]|uniref:DUF4219 domain-containing protein n=1 Tax=Gossypium hirsutum TaxID=3635 RepID=A0ABM3B018_GOSHI|nr:uncharacterized protein LOC121223290 [Gossypium hirsutum]